MNSCHICHGYKGKRGTSCERLRYCLDENISQTNREEKLDALELYYLKFIIAYYNLFGEDENLHNHIENFASLLLVRYIKEDKEFLKVFK